MSSSVSNLPTAQRETRWSLDTSIIALMIAGTSTFLDVYTTQALLPYLRKVYNATEVQVSLTISATTLATAITAPVVGLWAESIGRKKVIVPAIFGLSIPTLLAATSPSLEALIFWRFAQGLFIPGIIAVIMAYINEEWAGRGVGVAMSAYVSGTVLGGFIGRLLPGLITSHFEWRMAFVVLAVLNLLGGFGVRKWLPPAENFVASANIKASVRDAIAHLRSPRLLSVFGMGFTVLFSLVGAFTYVNFYLAAAPFHLSPAELGSVFFVYLLGLFVTPAAGKFMDRVGFLPTAVMALGMAAVGLLLTLPKNLPSIIAGLAVFSSGVFILQATATAQTGRVAGKSRSAAAGLYLTFYYGGGSLGAVLPGYVWLHYGWPGCVALLLSAGALTLALAIASSRA
ncbi:MAG TPA: MFS transporter [Clostridia bacterium]|nr:MFS transporter [Clostridia bacterium]